jgi:hypothetical protein
LKTLVGKIENTTVYYYSNWDIGQLLNCEIDCLIANCHIGKTFLGGLIMGGGGLIKKNANRLVSNLYEIEKIINNNSVPRCVLINTDIDKNKEEINIRYFCLVPSTYTDFYRSNAGMSSYIWKDYIYALTYYSLLLISKKSQSDIIGIYYDYYDHQSGNCHEYMLDAVNNFIFFNKGNYLIKQIIFLENSNLKIPVDTPIHKEIPHFYSFDERLLCDYIDFKLV